MGSIVSVPGKNRWSPRSKAYIAIFKRFVLDRRKVRCFLRQGGSSSIWNHFRRWNRDITVNALVFRDPPRVWYRGDDRPTVPPNWPSKPSAVSVHARRYGRLNMYSSLGIASTREVGDEWRRLFSSACQLHAALRKYSNFSWLFDSFRFFLSFRRRRCWWRA